MPATREKPTTSRTLESAIRAGRLLPEMSFCQKVWALTSRIPPGRVTTYGHIARQLQCKGARAIGMAMNKNPYAPAVPCHRVVGSTGNLTGYAGGLPKKRRMLKEEGVSFKGERVELDNVFAFE